MDHPKVSPFQPEKPRQQSACLIPQERDALDRLTKETPKARFLHVHHQFRSLVESSPFPCVAGQSTIKNRAFWHGIYQHMQSEEDARWLCHDLFDYIQIRDHLPGRFSTFIATFLEPEIASETVFEDLLWQLLQRLHALDVPHHAWSSTASSDTKDPNFGFSIAEQAFFIVGLNPASSRLSRRFSWPTLVFNSHDVFIEMENSGEIVRFQKPIRKRDLKLQGNLNPNLEGSEELSRAREFSGRAVPKNWRCPLRILSSSTRTE
ncbi:guanitoxin biosynthesis heme-dependent pre-guanitoxin N-hydroxylase GntA [Magnetococcales bacterium HHB-1]